MLLRQIALVSKSKNVEFRQLASVSAALQAQATRDFGPIWGVAATVDPFGDINDVPLGYWPIIVEDDISTPGASGVHEDRMGQPFALVAASTLWSLSASHECLEMLADPFGNRTMTGPKPVQDKSKRKSSTQVYDPSVQVEYLVEVCDPCEDAQFGYNINGILVSDFYTPQFFDPPATGGARYDFTGKIPKPLEVMENGYISWHDTGTDRWWQKFAAKSTLKIQPITAQGFTVKGDDNVRSAIDRASPTALEFGTVDGGQGMMLPFSNKPSSVPTLSNFDGNRPALIQAIRTSKILANLEGEKFEPVKRFIQKNGGLQKFDPLLEKEAKKLLEDIKRAKR